MWFHFFSAQLWIYFFLWIAVTSILLKKRRVLFSSKNQQLSFSLKSSRFYFLHKEVTFIFFKKQSVLFYWKSGQLYFLGKSVTHHRNNVRNPIPGVHDSAGEGAVLERPRVPGRGEGKHGLHCDVQARHVERFEHDLWGRIWGETLSLGEGLGKMEEGSRI